MLCGVTLLSLECSDPVRTDMLLLNKLNQLHLPFIFYQTICMYLMTHSDRSTRLAGNPSFSLDFENIWLYHFSHTVYQA